MKPIRNLGRVLTILKEATVHEDVLHNDLDAFYAPSVCHDRVYRGQAIRLRRARKHAEAVAGRKLRVIEHQAKLRGFNERSDCRLSQEIFCRIGYFG